MAITEKVTVTLSSETLAAGRARAIADGASFSAWLDQAARRQIRAEAAAEFAEWEKANLPQGFMDAADQAGQETLPASARW